MSKEHITYPSRQLTPEHLDALHLIKSFIQSYEDRNLDTQSRVIATDNFYKSCKNYGF